MRAFTRLAQDAIFRKFHIVEDELARVGSTPHHLVVHRCLGESTASIDPENEHLIQGALTELSKGKTVIIIAHRLATIEAADQILVINDGRIVEKGKHDELVKLGGKYAEFVKIREKAENWKIA